MGRRIVGWLVVAGCAAPTSPAAPPPVLRLGASHDTDQPLVIAEPQGPAVQLAVGDENTCVRTRDGRVVCWGPWGGQTQSPTVVAGLDDAIDVAVGSGHACARRQTGAVVCWGNSRSYWEGMTSTLVEPVEEIGALAGATAIGHGAYFACALGADQRVRCMGANSHGELGDGTHVGRAAPKLVNLTDVRQLAVGATHACARLGDGSVRCWGDNDDGQLGDGTATASAVPIEVANARGAVDLVAGRGISCVRDARGDVRCWGRAMTLPDHEAMFTPSGGPGELLDPGWHGAEAIWAGDHEACARLAGGTLACIGGLPDTRHALAGFVHAAEVRLGVRFGCVRTDRGAVGCWGDDEYGQRGSSSDRLAPVRVFGLAHATSLAAGDLATCAVLADHTARCWGRVQLDERSSELAAAPIEVPGWHDVASVSADQGMCAVTAAGHVACTPGSATVPPLDDVVELRMTRELRCARKRDGTAVCWDNYRPEPRVVTEHAVQLAGTFDTMCARGADHHVACWGDSLVTGEHAADSMVAVEVPGLVAEDLAVGAGHACALVSGGRVRCWGEGGYGQRGDGETRSARVRTPVQVTGITNATALAAGADHVCALLATRTVRCWGWNMHGQLGDGTTQDSAVPRDVVGLADVVQIVAHGTQTCARLADGTARCWGDDEFDQLGDALDGRAPQSHITIVVW